MKRFLRNILLLALVICLGGFVVIGILLKSFDPNDYIGQIEQRFLQATGRTLLLDGELRAAFFPVLGMKTGRIRIMDEATFGPDPFVRVDHTTFRLAIKPLLRKRVEVEEILLEGVSLKLAISSTGEKNWEFRKHDAEREARRLDEGITPLAPPDPVAAPKADLPDALNFKIAKLVIKDATVLYTDLGAGTLLKIALDRLELANLAFGQDISLVLSGYVQDGNGNTGAEAALKATLTIDPQGNVAITIDSLTVDVGEARASGTSSAGVSIMAQGAAQYDHVQKTFALPRLNGTIDSVPFMVRAEGFASGNAASVDEDTPGMSAEVRIDGELNVDKLQAAFYVTKKKEPVSQKTGPQAVGDSRERSASLPTALTKASPYTFLENTNASLVFFAQKIIAGGIPVEQVQAIGTLKKNTIALAPYSFRLFDGKFQGTVQADLTKKEAVTRVTLQGAGINAPRMLREVTGKNIIATGQGAVSADLTMPGIDFTKLLHSGKGTVAFSLHDATIPELPFLPDEMPDAEKLKKNLTVQSIKGSFQLWKGEASTKDLLLLSPLVEAKSTGSVHISSRELDLKTQITLKQQPIPITLSIFGPISAPQVRFRLDETAKGLVREILKDPEQVEKKLKHLRKKLQDKEGLGAILGKSGKKK